MVNKNLPDDNRVNELEKQLKNLELKYKTLLNTIPSMAWFTDKDSKYCDVNNELLIHCGKEETDIRNQEHNYVWNGSIGDKCRKYDLEVLSKKESTMHEEIVPGKRGYRRFNVNRSPVLNDQGEPLGVMAVARDITEIKNMDTQIQVLIENVPFKVWLCDKDGKYINANIKFAKSLNTTVEQLIGRNMREFYFGKELDDILEENRMVMDTKKTKVFIKEMIKDNKTRIMEVHKTPVLNIVNEVVGIVGTSVDITKLKDAESEIRKQAYTDSNTGLLNRRALYEYMGNRFKGVKVSLMIIDVDNFKHINDTYGHQVGDIILQKIAKTLKDICHDNAIFRFGGDEFMIILEDLGEDVVLDKVNKILTEVGKIKSQEKQDETIKVSIGISSCSCDGEGCKRRECELIRRADIALYKAKNLGKNRYISYTKDLEDEMILNYNIEKDLSHAIENNEITLFYQPQYTKNNKLKGFEALFRWDNKIYSHMPIIDIINIMEKSDLIITIGNEIMRKACLFAKQINENREEKIVVSFNASSIQIMDDNFINYVKEILRDTEVCTSCIGIEITETVLLENINENIKKLKELRDIGIKIYLDDFGTGYSSFNYLVKLPLSAVKIDKSFIDEMSEGEEYKKLIKLIIDSSHSMQLDTVAEGVETEEQLKELRNMGIEYIQGYIFSKPLKENDALGLLAKE